MKYKTVFWDIDGTLYDNEAKIPENKKDIVLYPLICESVSKSNLKFWRPYNGLTELIKEIPRLNQGIITNGIYEVQINKLKIFGLIDHINPELIFTSFGEAEKIINTPGHPLLKDFDFHSDFLDNVFNMTHNTQKPTSYMFEKALGISGFAGEECVMIGDDWKDVKGAQTVGMKTVYISGLNKEDLENYDPIGEGLIKPDFTIEKGDIKGLRKLLL